LLIPFLRPHRKGGTSQDDPAYANIP